MQAKANKGQENHIELVGGFLDSLRKKERNVKTFLDYLVSFYRWEVYFFIAMVIITRSCENDNIFYNCQKEFGNLFSYMCGLFPTFVESFVRLWNFSCNLVSSIPWKTTFISFYKIKIFIQFFSTTRILNPNLKLCSGLSKCNLLPPLMDNIVVAHIFLQLPLNPSMLWHLHQISKVWFTKFVNKSLLWNSFKFGIIDHRSCLQSIANTNIPR